MNLLILHVMRKMLHRFDQEKKNIVVWIVSWSATNTIFGFTKWTHLQLQESKFKTQL
jgi:hypothetical protein